MGNYESVKTVISSHFVVSPVASAKADGQLKTTEKHSLQKVTCADLLDLRGYFFDLLEDCRRWTKPQIIEVKTHPAGAAKEG
jgi:hypothetical protein